MLPDLIDQDTATGLADAGKGVVPPISSSTARLPSSRRCATTRARRPASSNPSPARDDRRHPRRLAGPRRADRRRPARRSPRPPDRRDHRPEGPRYSAAGVGRLPQGAAYYAMCLRFHTTTEMTPAEAHKVGLDQWRRSAPAPTPSSGQQGHTSGTVAQRITALGKDPAQLWPNTDAGRTELLHSIEERLADMRHRLPDYFGDAPENAAGGPPRAARDRARRAGRLFPVRQHRRHAPRRHLFQPARHGQLAEMAAPPPSITRGCPAITCKAPSPTRGRRHPHADEASGPAAYNEGWALYAEQLADEMGVYDAFPLGRLGMLQASIFRACRIVVDTGIHSLGLEPRAGHRLSRRQCRRDARRRPPRDRALAPGRARPAPTRSAIFEFVRLRDQAKRRLGNRFDLKGFHDAVLLGGAMPLDVMAGVVDDWALSRRRG